MIVVDSSIWIDLFRKVHNDATRKFLGLRSMREVVVGDVVLYEVMRGARDAAQAKKIEQELTLFETRSFLGVENAIKAATKYRQLRSMGITVRKFPDVLIGSWCIENDCLLLHNDRDFRPMVEHLGLREY